MRDEHDGLARFLPDAQQLEVHLLAGERIERAEGLVHQYELRIVHQRPRDRRPLLHAAGELVRVLRFVAGEADELQEMPRTLARFSAGEAEDLGWQ